MTSTTPQIVILLTETDPVIAIDLIDVLTEAGYRVVGPVTTVAGALLLLEQERPGLAVIDVGLKDGPSAELAFMLRQRGVPFIIHSAASPDQQPDGAFAGVPWLSKPALPTDVVAVLNELSTSPPAVTGQVLGFKQSASGRSPHPSATAHNPLVRKLEGFVPLSEADKAILVQISAETRRVMPGIDLVREGDRPDSVVLVMDGIACRHKLRASGARQIMAYLVAGDMGDLDVTLLRTMDHTITTLSVCAVVRLAPATVAALLQHHPRIARALRMAQLVDEGTLREWLVNVGRRSAKERIAHLFCELLVRLQVVERAEHDYYALPITQTDLADTTGLTTVHVNRTLRELRRERLIELRNGHLRIFDLAQLQTLAEFRPNYLHLGDRTAA